MNLLTNRLPCPYCRKPCTLVPLQQRGGYRLHNEGGKRGAHLPDCLVYQRKRTAVKGPAYRQRTAVTA